jgi:hypothetical protein
MADNSTQGPWTRDQISSIAAEVCRIEAEKYRPVLEWAESKRIQELKVEERMEKIRTTVLGQSLIWLCGAALFFTGDGALSFLKKIIGAAE